MASEKLLLKIPHQRIVCCHSAGSMTFGPGGLLHISTGDDTEHSQSQGYNPIDDDVLRNNPGDNPDADRAYDSRRTSGNTNDLRGKILRIKPEADGTYSIPPGNLFPPVRVRPGEDQARDLHDGPSQPVPDPGRPGDRLGLQRRGRPRRRLRERQPRPARLRRAQPDPPGGQHGLAVLHRRQQGLPRLDVPVAARPARRSTAPADRTTRPTTTRAWPRRRRRRARCCGGRTRPTPTGFPWATGPTAIPTGSGRTAIAGPIYHFNPDVASDTKLPAYYDDKVFFADWSRDWIATLTLDAQGKPAEVRRFLPDTEFRHPQDIEMGPDGTLYVLEWGRDFNYAGSGINPDSGLYRIDYVKGSRTPIGEGRGRQGLRCHPADGHVLERRIRGSRRRHADLRVGLRRRHGRSRRRPTRSTPTRRRATSPRS